VGLQRLADGGHVVRVRQVAPDQAVEPAPGRDLLGRRGAHDRIGGHLDLRPGDLAQVDLDDPGRVRQHDF
jgi:hypothetical protein